MTNLGLFSHIIPWFVFSQVHQTKSAFLLSDCGLCFYGKWFLCIPNEHLVDHVLNSGQGFPKRKCRSYRLFCGRTSANRFVCFLTWAKHPVNPAIGSIGLHNIQTSSQAAPSNSIVLIILLRYICNITPSTLHLADVDPLGEGFEDKVPLISSGCSWTYSRLSLDIRQLCVRAIST